MIFTQHLPSPAPPPASPKFTFVEAEYTARRRSVSLYDRGFPVEGGALPIGRSNTLSVISGGVSPSVPAFGQEERLKKMAELSQFVWGNVQESNAFLLRPNQSLNGEVPIQLASTAEGVQRVERVLNAILHGLPA